MDILFFNKQSPILAQYSVSFPRININQRQFLLINIIQLCLTLVWIWRKTERKKKMILNLPTNLDLLITISLQPDVTDLILTYEFC